MLINLEGKVCIENKVIQKKIELIKKGRSEFEEIFAQTDFRNETQYKEARAVLNAKKGGYSRKLGQFIKYEYINELLEINLVPMVYKNFHETCLRIFDESITKHQLASIKKDRRHGTGVQDPLKFEETQVQYHRLHADFIVKEHRSSLLNHLDYCIDTYSGKGYLYDSSDLSHLGATQGCTKKFKI